MSHSVPSAPYQIKTLNIEPVKAGSLAHQPSFQTICLAHVELVPWLWQFTLLHFGWVKQKQSAMVVTSLLRRGGRRCSLVQLGSVNSRRKPALAGHVCACERAEAKRESPLGHSQVLSHTLKTLLQWWKLSKNWCGSSHQQKLISQAWK